MKFFDTHCHYNDERYNENRNSMLLSLKEQNVQLIMNAGTNPETSKECIDISEQYDFAYASVGVHPHSAGEANEESFVTIEKLAQHKKVRAIGEIGLDYHYDFAEKNVQKEVFARQMELAEKLDLPVIIHNREAHMDVLDIIKSHKTRGILHCYSGSVEMMKQLLKLDYYISFAGSITFKNANKLLDVVREVPLERMLIETDCPYLTPVPFRGKINHSGLLIYIAEKIAEIKNLSVEEVAEISFKNGKKVFNID